MPTALPADAYQGIYAPGSPGAWRPAAPHGRAACGRRAGGLRRSSGGAGKKRAFEFLIHFQKLWRTACVCAADARQAVAPFATGLPSTALHALILRSRPRDDKLGWPQADDLPPARRAHMAGALASSLAARAAQGGHERCFLATPHALDQALLGPWELCEAYQGQPQAERGCRCRKSPELLAASLSLQTPARMRALFMVMPVCWLVSAALAYRMRQALKNHDAPVPDPKGKRLQHPTARWGFSFVGLHLLSVAGQWPLLRNLPEEQCNLLKLLGKPYMQLYGVTYS